MEVIRRVSASGRGAFVGDDSGGFRGTVESFTFPALVGSSRLVREELGKNASAVARISSPLSSPPKRAIEALSTSMMAISTLPSVRS